VWVEIHGFQGGEVVNTEEMVVYERSTNPTSTTSRRLMWNLNSAQKLDPCGRSEY
jgi:hypothetical protein